MPKVPVEYIQEAPFALQVELSEGCNLRCTFCGLNGIRGKDNDFKFMTVKTATELANQILKARWNVRVEFAMHGEPSANPDMDEIVHLFRDILGKNTQLMMTSNGAGFMKDPTKSVDSVLRSLNVLALDNYETVKIVPTILKRYEGVHVPIHYPKCKEGNPHLRRKPTEHDFVIVEDIALATKGTHSLLNNHAGCGSPPNNDGQGKRCAKPFRELSVRWDGSIAICCNDWRGIYKCGNIHDINVVDIWNGEVFVAARKKLYHGLRDFGPCLGCDATSYRVGLLPDKKGQQSLPLPNDDDLKAIAKAVRGKSLTLPVLRSWEA